SMILGLSFLGIKDATPRTSFVADSPNPAEVPVGKPLPKTEEEKRRQEQELASTKARPFVRATRVGYLLPFEIVSVHLLVLRIGAAYLARAKRRRGTVS